MAAGTALPSPTPHLGGRAFAPVMRLRRKEANTSPPNYDSQVTSESKVVRWLNPVANRCMDVAARVQAAKPLLRRSKPSKM